MHYVTAALYTHTPLHRYHCACATAEMTGRKGRLVRDPSTGGVVYEARNANGIALDMQNISERDSFMVSVCVCLSLAVLCC
jgi:C-terminal domain on Strawberry notch homologue